MYDQIYTVEEQKSVSIVYVKIEKHYEDFLLP